MRTFVQWLSRKWQPDPAEPELIDVTALTFGTEHGRAWLNYMMDNVYCTVCLSHDPYELAAHNAQRALIHDILQKLDQHAHPDKFAVKQPEEPVIEPRG